MQNNFFPSFSVPPKIFSFSKDLVVNEGSNVSLMCLANGKPDPVVSWRSLSTLGKRKSHSFLWNLECFQAEVRELPPDSWVASHFRCL